MTEKGYMEKFGIGMEQMESIVAEGLKGGGDWCDLYFEDSFYGELVLRDGNVNAGGCNCDFGCGIRVLKGEKTGYAYAESCEYGALVQAARAAGAIAMASSDTHFTAMECRQKAPDAYRMESDWREAGLSRFIPTLEYIDRQIHAREASTDKVTVEMAFGVSDIMMFNSLGELRCDTRPIGTIRVMAIFSRNGRCESNNVSLSRRGGAEVFGPDAVEEIISKAVEGVDAMFEARRPKGGKMSVVMGAGASGILLHEAMGHAFEADFNRKGQSVFCDKMGKRICRKGINIVDDGTLPGNRGACNWDDEGIPGQKTFMVTDGVLSSYLHDRISASAYGVAPTGNGRRESFRYHPIPRMRSTYMLAGTDGSARDLIGEVKKGIFVDQFANGEVKIGEGDFTFYVKRGRLIENGRLTMPVKDVNVSGNGPQALADIVAVGSDLEIDGGAWTCGKEQQVPVSCGIPSVLVKSLVVGGE